MNVIATFSVIAVALFLAAYVTKRRFGLLGLALGAGATLSTIWSYDAGLIVGSLGIFQSGPTTTAITLSLIVLLPAVVLLFHGFTYKNFVSRTVGAFLFTALALAFLIQPLGYALTLEGTGGDIYRWLDQYKNLIISVGMILAVVDLFFTKPVRALERKAKR